MSTRVTRTRDGWSFRCRTGKGGHLRYLVPASFSEPDAKRRAEQCILMARALVAAARATEATLVVRDAAKASAEDFRAIQGFVRELCVEAGKQTVAIMTFRELGDQWVKGDLHRRYPDRIPIKRTALDDAGRLLNHIYPVIGAKSVASVTLDDCDEIMRRIPEGASRSRRHIAGTVTRLLGMAVYPLRLIERSPIPPKWLPRPNKRKALTYLFPANDRALLTCNAVPFGYRLLWGFLAREGMREGEALALTWGDVDLAHGMVKLDQNKTDDPRAWALDPGVTRALTVYREHFAPEAEPSEPVFIQRSKWGIAETFREHLNRAGVKAKRPELFVRSESRQPIRVHDLRGTFVTLALANGRSEAWVMARTGHRSSAMVNRYVRIATSFAELQLGELAPLCQAIPELARLASVQCTDLLGVPEGVPRPLIPAKFAATPTGIEPVLPA